MHPSGDFSSTRPEAKAIYAWTPVIWFGTLLVLAYAPVLVKLIHQWHSDDDMAHGLFAPVVAGYLAWQKRGELAAQPLQPNRWGLALGVWGMLQLTAGLFGANLFLARTAFLISLIGVILYLCGPAALRTLAFPLFLLLFMIPVPQFFFLMITVRLQLLASQLSEVALEMLGYTVLRTGNVLEMVGHQLSVEQACSGIRSLFSLTFLTLIYAYLAESRFWVRVFVVAAAVPTAILINSARIVLAGMLFAHDPQLASGVVHNMFGWVMMLGGFAVQIALHRWAVNGLIRYVQR